MAGPEDWGAVPVAESPEAWGAKPAEPTGEGGPATFDERFQGGLTEIPPAFYERVRKGQVMRRVLNAAAAGAEEGFGTGTPTGISDQTLQQLIDLGFFHDPLVGKPTPIQFM